MGWWGKQWRWNTGSESCLEKQEVLSPTAGCPLCLWSGTAFALSFLLFVHCDNGRFLPSESPAVTDSWILNLSHFRSLWPQWGCSASKWNLRIQWDTTAALAEEPQNCSGIPRAPWISGTCEERLLLPSSWHHQGEHGREGANSALGTPGSQVREYEGSERFGLWAGITATEAYFKHHHQLSRE